MTRLAVLPQLPEKTNSPSGLRCGLGSAEQATLGTCDQFLFEDREDLEELLLKYLDFNGIDLA